MDARKTVLKETSVIAIGEVVGVLAMFGVFALMGMLDRKVLLGGAIGALLAIGNFLMMAINVSVAADRAAGQNVKGGKALISTSYMMRLAVIFIILFACVKGGLCNVFACVIPMLFVRPTITIAEFFRKAEENQP